MEYKHEKYDEFIQSIINERGQWCIEKDEYFETHHIIPKCMGGLPNGKVTGKIHDNLIWLYPDEHFIAHKLLAEENPDNKKLCSAYFYLCNTTARKSIITESDYLEAKNLWSEHMKHPKSAETRQKISDNAKINPNFGTKGKHLSDETKAKIGKANSKSLRGRKIPEENIKNMSKAQSGLVWWNNGFVETKSKESPGEGFYRGRLQPSLEIVNKRAKSLKGHVVSNETRIKIGKANSKPKPESFSKKMSKIMKAKFDAGYKPVWTGKHLTEEQKERCKITGAMSSSNTKWYTNGIQNKRIKIGSDIPEGYFPGRSNYHRGDK